MHFASAEASTVPVARAESHSVAKLLGEVLAPDAVEALLYRIEFIQLHRFEFRQCRRSHCHILHLGRQTACEQQRNECLADLLFKGMGFPVLGSRKGSGLLIDGGLDVSSSATSSATTRSATTAITRSTTPQLYPGN